MRNLKYRFLSSDFYNDYKDCSEILQKPMRPYAIAIVHYNGIDFAVPFRSHIKHKNAFFTTMEKDKGLDYTKAVPLLKPNYIDDNKMPATISKEERASLFNKANQIEKELNDYILKYIKAFQKGHIRANQIFCKHSCLQYFHKELGI